MDIFKAYFILTKAKAKGKVKFKKESKTLNGLLTCNLLTPVSNENSDNQIYYKLTFLGIGWKLYLDHLLFKTSISILTLIITLNLN